jgi:hypothetical protein
MQRVGIVRLDREHALIARLGFDQTAGLMQRKTGLQAVSDGISNRSAGRTRKLGADTALLAIHGRNLN